MPKPIKYPKELITIGDHLRKRRLDLELLQIEVSRILNVTEDTITYWENGRSTPQISAIPSIIAFLGYNPYPIDRSTLGGRITEYRYLNGVSKAKLAKELNVDPSKITRWENDQFIPFSKNYVPFMRLLDDILKISF